MNRNGKKYAVIAIWIVAGSICGYLYYYYVGCNSGTCVISSNPVTSVLYGALLAGLISSLLMEF